MNRSGVVGGALFGGDIQLAQVQGRLHRKLAIVRVYYQIGESFPTAMDKPLLASHSTLLVSLDAPPSGPTYSAIASGRYDATIRSFLEGMEHTAVSHHLNAIYFSFEHEMNWPSTHARLGSPRQFIEAWDHIHALAASLRLDWNTGGRIHWVWILGHEAYTPLKGRAKWEKTAGTASEYWPGANETDVVAADGYNSGRCMRARATRPFVDTSSAVTTPAELFGPVVSFARAHGNLPVFISEWGTVPYRSTAAQGDFIRQMESFVDAHQDIAASMYWNHRAAGTGCDYSINSNPAAFAAMTAMGHARRLQGRLARVP